jgi:predicted AAA+ superfamily ATPase
MKRIVEQKMLDWVDSPRRKPLIIRGARQVGKTWLVENCLAKRFDSFIKIDLEKQPQFHAAFTGDLSPRKVLDSIEAYTGRILPGKTLLFIDEIQSCPRAIMALRYFYEEAPELHVVAAGSMLEFAFGDISVPVGRVQYMYVAPMTFYEYLLAMGKDVAAEKVLTHPREHPKGVVEAIREQLRDYFLVGGMPEAVEAYRQTHSKLEAFEVHSQILTSYREDFAKYRPAVNYACLDGVFDSACRSVGQQIKYTQLYQHASGVTNHKAFDLLCKAKLLHSIRSSDPSGLPLGGATGKRFKACMLDIGLMQHLCGIDAASAVQAENLLGIYRGKLAEQFIAQEMLAWHAQKLYYWSRAAKNSNAEVDYLAVRDGKIYPLEVKSGSAGRLKSLHLCLETYPNCEQGWVLQDGPYRELPEQKLVFWPLYATPHLGNREQF